MKPDEIRARIAGPATSGWRSASRTSGWLCGLAVVSLAAAAPAYAHGGGQAGSGFGESWLLIVIAAAAAVFVLGVARAWTRAGFGRAVRPGQATLFLLGLSILAATLLPPLHGFAETLFTGHMIEHELIMAVAAPILVLSRPLPAFLFALPAVLRRSGLPGRLIGSGLFPVLTRPAVATALHGVALWGWHVPSAFTLATTDPLAHAAQHASFLLTALLFWWAVMERPGRSDGASALHLFLTMLHMGALGALITLAPAATWPVADPAAWGLTPLEDQQLAGIVMWVLGGFVYLGAALFLLGRWIAGRGAAPDTVSWRQSAS